MKKSIQVKPEVQRLMKFMTLIEEGKIKIPTFQRDFVWKDKEKIELFDSISKEYPIGSVLLWQPNKQFSNKDKIGPYSIEHLDESNFFYVLDGFQRLSTLFGCLTDPEKTSLFYDEDMLKKDFTMFYNLQEQRFKMGNAYPLITDIPVHMLIDTFSFLDFIDKLRNQLREDPSIDTYIERARELSATLIDYQVPSIEIIGGSIKDAVDIFSRINSKGVEISSDWMLSALTSNEENNFNLGEQFSELLEDLREYNFDGLKREILVQCIQSAFGKIYFDQTVEELAKRPDFQNISIMAIKSVKKSIKFLFEELLVIDKKLLPYNYQLIFLTHFFNHTEIPNEVQLKQLKKWFWITTYSNYFTINSLSKIREAFEQFKLFTKNEILEPVYYHNRNQKYFTADLPSSVSSGSVRSKAFQLFLLNYSNHFNRVYSTDIQALKTQFLYKYDRSHSGLVPVIIYTNHSDEELPFIFNKQREMSYLLDGDITDFKKEYFFTELMVNLHKNLSFETVLDVRIKLIESEEREFVDNLGITYSE